MTLIRVDQEMRTGAVPRARKVKKAKFMTFHSRLATRRTVALLGTAILLHSCQPSRFWRNSPAFLTLFRHPDREFQNSAFCSVKYNAEMQAAEFVNCKLK